jgi:hypothetical protein
VLAQRIPLPFFAMDVLVYGDVVGEGVKVMMEKRQKPLPSHATALHQLA